MRPVWPKGIAPYEKAVALRPNEPLLLIGLASCLLSKGATGGPANQAVNQKAIDHLRAALRLDPLNGPAYLQMSKGYGQLGEIALAQWALAEYYAAGGKESAAPCPDELLKDCRKDRLNIFALLIF